MESQIDMEQLFMSLAAQFETGIAAVKTELEEFKAELLANGMDKFAEERVLNRFKSLNDKVANLVPQLPETPVVEAPTVQEEESNGNQDQASESEQQP